MKFIGCILNNFGEILGFLPELNGPSKPLLQANLSYRCGQWVQYKLAVSLHQHAILVWCWYSRQSIGATVEAAKTNFAPTCSISIFVACGLTRAYINQPAIRKVPTGSRRRLQGLFDQIMPTSYGALYGC